MALATTYLASNVLVTTSSSLVTTVNTAGTYVRDLVITNAGTSGNIYVTIANTNNTATGATTTGSMVVPTGQSLILAGSLPSPATVYSMTSSGTVPVSVGYASVFSVI